MPYDLHSECQRVIHALLQKYDWELLDEAEFIQRLVARALEEHVEASARLEKLAMNIYALALFEACASTNEPSIDERCKRGFTEIGRFLSRLIKKHYSDLVEDQSEIIVQDALRRIYLSLSQCREPGAFFAFCALRLRHAVDAYIRERKRTQDNTPLQEVEDEENNVPKELTYTDNLPELSSQDCIELRSRELNRFQELLQLYPKAERQLKAVFYVYYENLTHAEAASKLATNENNVDVLLSRGRGRLKTDDEFIAILREIVVNCKDLLLDVPLL